MPHPATSGKAQLSAPLCEKSPRHILAPIFRIESCVESSRFQRVPGSRVYLCDTKVSDSSGEFFPCESLDVRRSGSLRGKQRYTLRERGGYGVIIDARQQQKNGGFYSAGESLFRRSGNFDRRSATLCEKSPHTLDLMDRSSGDVIHNGDGRIPICGSMGSHPLGFSD